MTDTQRGAPSAGQQGHSEGVQRQSQGMQQRQSEGIRQRAIDAYDSARDSAYSAGRKASGAMKDAPLAVVGAGIAAGALIAALLPTTRRERDLLAPYGSKVTGAARDAADAARSAGSQKLQELGLMPDDLLDKAGETVKTSAQAAATTIKEDAQAFTGQASKGQASKGAGKGSRKSATTAAGGSTRGSTGPKS